MYCSILLLLLGWTYALHMHENVIFNQVNEIVLTKSKWLMTIVVDLDSYQNFLDKLSTDIDDASALAEIVIKRYTKDGHDNYKATFKSLHNEVLALKTTFDSIMDSYIDFRSLRNKRSILPLGGEILNFLFGTVSQDQIDVIQRNINHLSANQQNIVHVLKESISLLNSSRMEIAVNRHSINDILSTLSDIDIKINNVTEVIEKRFVEMENFIKMYLQLDLITEELKQVTQRALWTLQHLKLKLNMLSSERLSPSVIAPAMLRKILLEIENKLPRSLRLPDNPNKTLWKYYKYLTCSTIVRDKQILIVVSIPLLDLSSTYKVFNVHNLPLPFMNRTKGVIQSTEMTAQLEIEANSIAFNVERTKYILLDKFETHHCSNPWLNYCQIQSPIYPVSLNRICVVSLFLKHDTNIKQYCRTKVHFRSHLPVAEFIGHGKWAVATSKLLKFSIVCQNTSKSMSEIQIEPPLGIIYLNTFCLAANRHLSLTSPFDGRSQYYIHDKFLDLIGSHVNVSGLHLWEPFHNSLSNITKINIPKELEEIKYMPMNRLIQRLQSVNMVPTESKGWSTWVYLFIGVISVIILGIIIVIYHKYSDQIKTYWLAIRGGNEGKNTKRSLPSSCELAVEESTSMNNTNRKVYPTPKTKEEHTATEKRTHTIDILSII